LSRVAPLFAAVPGLHGCLHAVLEGTMGRVLADSPTDPTVALAELDFWFCTGDPHAAGVDEVLRSIEMPASFVTDGSAWEAALLRVWGDALESRTRVAFAPGTWDRERLRSFMEDLPDGMAVRRVGPEHVEVFEELAESLVYNFDSLDEFLRRGVGFGIQHEGRFVSGCSSFAISSRSLEFEIQTHPDYRRRGLATATAAAMIEYCLDAGLEPCWDAHNEQSAGLATKLGFVDPRPYTAYELPATARPVS